MKIENKHFGKSYLLIMGRKENVHKILLMK